MAKEDRYRNLRPKPENLGVTPLAAGEGTHTFRVRARQETLDKFGKMTAEERGRFIERAYELLDAEEREG